MKLAEEVMALVSGSEELEQIRSKAMTGDQDSLVKYVWWSVWKKLKSDTRFSRRAARDMFVEMVEEMPMRVGLDG